jgi:hypothetical protein
MTQCSASLKEVSGFTDQQLIARLRDLVRADQRLGGRLLVHLGEVDARGLYRERAYSSMFAYCVEELNMSEAEAYLRIQVARLGRQFPLVVQLFEQGTLHLSAIKLLGPHLTAGNHVQLLERASGKRKRELELLLAELAPKPDVPSRTRKLPERSRAPDSRARTPVAPLLDAHPASSVVDVSIAASSVLETQAPFALEGFIAAPLGASEANRAPFALEATRPRASCVPLSPGRYEVKFTAGRGLHDKLEQLRALLRHRVPDGDLAVIVELAVDLLFDKTMKQRFAQTPAPKKSRTTHPGDERARTAKPGDERERAADQLHPLAARETVAAASGSGSLLETRDRSSPGGRPRQVNSRYNPRAVVREVYERDGAQCTFVSSDGKRCSERGFLELHHHDVPYGKGGKATVDNLRLACRAHNQLFAERDYGTRFMRFKQLQARTNTRTDSLVSK